jgi:hypothetical protein
MRQLEEAQQRVWPIGSLVQGSTGWISEQVSLLNEGFHVHHQHRDAASQVVENAEQATAGLARMTVLFVSAKGQ